jgi:type IV secretory pathway VirB4 component
MEGKNFGEYTLSVVIYDEDRLKVDSALAEFQKLFTQRDGLLYEERYNLLNTFFATVPGNRQFNLRKQWGPELELCRPIISVYGGHGL